tara:strand:+ start:2028 stop:2684 length:657 start_codon:yes stop_codon:yes gene_type:complete
MATLYYGKGCCTIEGEEIRGIEIRYKGAIRMKKTCNNSFVIGHHVRLILIFPIGYGFLSNLFEYTGEFKILSVVVADNNGEKVPCGIKKMVDYPELIDSNFEDMTLNVEEMNAGEQYGAKAKKTLVDINIAENLHTGTQNVKLYKRDGTLYNGSFHIHINPTKPMTGATHTKDSEKLFTSKVGDKVEPKKTRKRTRRRAKTRVRARKASSSIGGGGGY